MGSRESLRGKSPSGGTHTHTHTQQLLLYIGVEQERCPLGFVQRLERNTWAACNNKTEVQSTPNPPIACLINSYNTLGTRGKCDEALVQQ